MITPLRRLVLRQTRRIATSAVLIALPLFAVPSLAAAQAACIDAPLTAYLAHGFDCRIGAWAFDSFEYFTFAEAEQSLFARVTAADGVRIHPFSFLDSLGRQNFGFKFDALGSSVGVAGANFGGSEAFSEAEILFSGHSLDASAGLVEASLELSGFLDGTAPATHFLFSSASGVVGSSFSSVPCLIASAEVSDLPGSIRTTQTHDCFDELPLFADVFAGSFSALTRSDIGNAEQFIGSTSAAVLGVTFVTATPEPATALLVAPALLGIFVARRRRASMREEQKR